MKRPKREQGSEAQDELQQLREENSRLKAVLEQHGIAWEASRTPAPSAVRTEPPPTSARFTTAEKVALFRRLFRGREDVYAQRWQSAKGTAGYAPACANEWKPGICHKPSVKCAACNHRQFLPVTGRVIHDHLSGTRTIGVYPLLTDDSCYLLAADFDEADWRQDAKAFMRSCRDLGVPATLEISRSGNGAHAWIFFAEPVQARDARQLGAALISHACERTRQLSLASYDRLFPNQDTLPKGGFGNLIALPLQKQPRASGRSVFVDERLEPYVDQWAYLASVRAMSRWDLDDAIHRASGGRHPLDVAFAAEDEGDAPWRRPKPVSARIAGPLPESLRLVLANEIFVAKADLPRPLANRLIRLAAFQNPEFYKAQAMRRSVWNIPRVIGCAQNHPRHIGLPRGCLEEVLELLRRNDVRPVLKDERLAGRRVAVEFTGTLRDDQETAVQEMLEHDIGVLCAPSAFGKTVAAAALIARREVSTLILVHRTELLRQWRERMSTFLALPAGAPGAVGGGRNELSGEIDIAVIQSLSRREELVALLDRYGQIIVDECHHLPAFSFESILRRSNARYVAGLTATPRRRDGHQPIIFMQCGPIRYRARTSETAPAHLEVRPKALPAPAIPPDAPIQSVFRILANDATRNRRIAADVLAAYREGRKVLVLTERTDHLSLLREALGDEIEHCHVLHGRMSKKQRAAVFADLEALEGSTPRVLLATGRLIGEGFDHPPLDTLVLAMPISWQGTLRQYAGRLHRDHADKRDVRIRDYVEADQPQLARMWNKRRRGYEAMGYEIRPAETGLL